MILKTALVAALVLSSASMALAATHHARSHGFYSRNVALPYSYGYGSARESWMDRASRTTSSGGN
jgi:hypothetical protein